VQHADTSTQARRPEDIPLLVGLLGGDSGLGRRGLEAIVRIRHRQLETLAGSSGAFVKLLPRQSTPLLDLARLGAGSPLTTDYHSLFVLELIDLFPEHAAALGALAQARRNGLDLPGLARALYAPDADAMFHDAASEHACDARLLRLTLQLALKPLFEGVAAACRRHFEVPSGGEQCPICGGQPWARAGDRLRCGVCETDWQAELPGHWSESGGVQPKGARRLVRNADGMQIAELDAGLFGAAFDPDPYIELLKHLTAHGSEHQPLA
jgi:ribosomal protein S27AE